jgi:SMODS and SLOG-associating 2TM effector domain
MLDLQGDEEMGTRPNVTLPKPPPMVGLIASRVAGILFGNRDQDGDAESEMPSDQPDELLSTDNPLSIFRRITGIHSSPTHRTIKKLHLHRPAPNQGIYQHVIDEEDKAGRKYVFFSRLINGCLGLQIVVAAALTALGAGDGPHAIVTVFGAVNTVIAGFLTYLKGSGLPNQAKCFQSEWSKLREYIELRERDFGCAGFNNKNVYEEIRIVEDEYNRIRREIEANTPDGYMPMSKAVEKKIEGSYASSNRPRDTVRRPTVVGQVARSDMTVSTEPGGEMGRKSREEKKISEY